MSSKTRGSYRYNYTELCNLTTDNGGMSWYCGKPADRKLLCDDWELVKTVRKRTAIPDIEHVLLRYYKLLQSVHSHRLQSTYNAGF